jgi:hypothetical protein
MGPALHPGDPDAIDGPENELPGVSDGRGTGKVRDLGVGNLGGVLEFVGKGPQARAENHRNLRAKLAFAFDESGSLVGLEEFASCLGTLFFVRHEKAKSSQNRRNLAAPSGAETPVEVMGGDQSRLRTTATPLGSHRKG